MRDIRFRAWAKYGEMLPNVQNHIGGGEWAFGNMLNSDDFEIMQFTGLKDKNGVEIYEGDIATLDGITFECMYSAPCFEMYNLDGDPSELLDWSGFEVIGNIYENLELLP